MGVSRGVHTCNAHLLWSRGSALYGLSGPVILNYGELSTISREAQTRDEPRSMGSAQRNRDRRGDPQA